MEKQYKQLNKELVEQVQEMRNTLKEYRDEVLYLRAKAMDDNIKYLNLRSKVAASLLPFRNLLSELDPTSSMLNSFINTDATQSSRQSSRLVEEMRRSSSVVQTRRSFNSVSPVRSPALEPESPEIVEIGEYETSANMLAGTQTIREEEEDGDEAEHYILERTSTGEGNEVSREEEDMETLAIREDNCDEDEDQIVEQASPGTGNGDLEENSDTSQDSDCIENLSQTFGQLTTGETEMNPCSNSMRTLRDVTNTQGSDTAKTSKSKNITIGRGRNKLGGGTENNKIPYNVEKDISELGATSIEEVRHNTRQSERQMETSFRISNQERVLPSISQDFSLTDISMENFRVESSSTPRNTIRNNNDIENANSTFSRPKRNCKPVSLAEKSLRYKIRNESAEKSLGNRKRSHK